MPTSVRRAATAAVFVIAGGGALCAQADRAAAAAAQAGSPAVTGRTPAAIYREACLTCHGVDGKGSLRSVVGFEAPLPDFTDCAFASGEPDPDWYAVVHEGGPIRGLDQHMPAFGTALSADEIALAVSHLRTFCSEPQWPRGDLNLPRAFFTEKAFPENEAVWSTSFSRHDGRSISNSLIYERRFGARNQIEVVVPLDFSRDSTGPWTRGIGDVAFAFKRAIYASLDAGRIAAAGVELIVPTGNEANGLGNGYAVFEPFAMWGQMLPKNSYLQMHGGFEFPTDTTNGTREAYLRTAIGTTFAQDRGFGRAWSPQVEVLWARPKDGASEWDIVPQVQITLSKLQHVMVAAGVRVPLSERQERGTQGLVYLLWDWFDGGFFEFWK